jgi:hypothetical protein
MAAITRGDLVANTVTDAACLRPSYATIGVAVPSDDPARPSFFMPNKQIGNTDPPTNPPVIFIQLITNANSIPRLTSSLAYREVGRPSHTIPIGRLTQSDPHSDPHSIIHVLFLSSPHPNPL